VQNVHQSTWDRGIFYADRASIDEQHLIKPLLRKTKDTNTSLKFTFCFMGATHEPSYWSQTFHYPLHIPNPYFFKINLILSVHQCLGLVSGFFLSNTPTIVSIHFSFLPCVLHPCQSHSPGFDHSNIRIYWTVQVVPTITHQPMSMG
jgi:hypothetical protein